MEQEYYINNFEDWVSLANEDPDAFERLRQELIDEFIDSAPPDRRKHLRSLQWRIEQERARSQTPLGACIRITRMMWERLTSAGGLVDQLRNLSNSLEHPGDTQVRRAQVLEFPPKAD